MRTLKSIESEFAYVTEMNEVKRFRKRTEVPCLVLAFLKVD
jgi:hypothetical protein